MLIRSQLTSLGQYLIFMEICLSLVLRSSLTTHLSQEFLDLLAFFLLPICTCEPLKGINFIMASYFVGRRRENIFMIIRSHTSEYNTMICFSCSSIIMRRSIISLYPQRIPICITITCLDQKHCSSNFFV